LSLINKVSPLSVLYLAPMNSCALSINLVLSALEHAESKLSDASLLLNSEYNSPTFLLQFREVKSGTTSSSAGCCCGCVVTCGCCCGCVGTCGSCAGSGGGVKWSELKLT
jgi:hypothetical protein